MLADRRRRLAEREGLVRRAAELPRDAALRLLRSELRLVLLRIADVEGSQSLRALELDDMQPPWSEIEEVRTQQQIEAMMEPVDRGLSLEHFTLELESLVLSEPIGQMQLADWSVTYLKKYVPDDARRYVNEDLPSDKRLPYRFAVTLQAKVGELDVLTWASGGTNSSGPLRDALDVGVANRLTGLERDLLELQVDWIQFSERRLEREGRALPPPERLVMMNAKRLFTFRRSLDAPPDAVRVDNREGSLLQPLRHAYSGEPHDGRRMGDAAAAQLAVDVLLAVGCDLDQAGVLAFGNEQAGGSFKRVMEDLLASIGSSPNGAVALSGAKIAKWIERCESRFDSKTVYGAVPVLPNLRLSDVALSTGKGLTT